MKKIREKKYPPEHRAPHRKVQHQGETVSDFLARGGKIKKLDEGIADGAIPFTKRWPGGRV